MVGVVVVGVVVAISTIRQNGKKCVWEKVEQSISGQSPHSQSYQKLQREIKLKVVTEND